MTLLFVTFITWGMLNANLSAKAGDMFLFMAIFLLATMLGMVMSLWLIYAVGYVVVEEKKLLETPSEDIKPEETSTEIEPKTEE